MSAHQTDGNQITIVVPFLNPQMALVTDDVHQCLFLPADIGEYQSEKTIDFFH